MKIEVCDIVQKAVIKTILRKEKCKKAKWLFEEALQIAEKRRKRQRKKERYKHLNAEFQRIARRDKKAFLSDQCKEIEGNNRMGKTGDHFSEFQGNILCKDGYNKGQKQYGPNRSRIYYEEVTRITEELYKKYLHDPDNHNGVITYLEPDILECGP